jgi:hypothetical protein
LDSSHAGGRETVEYTARITVEDVSRARFEVCEFRGKRLFKHFRVLALLETGERVKQRDLATFVVVETGEVFVALNSYPGGAHKRVQSPEKSPLTQRGAV